MAALVSRKYVSIEGEVDIILGKQRLIWGNPAALRSCGPALVTSDMLCIDWPSVGHSMF